MLALTLTAELNGITNLEPVDTPENPHYFSFQVQCTSCRELHPNWIGLSRHESNDISGSRGEANFVWRCKACKRESTASITEIPAKYVQESPPKAQQIIKIDCRGLEFTKFRADGVWTAVGTESSTKFTNIDLDEGEWYDYDEKASEEVSIKDVKWDIRRA